MTGAPFPPFAGRPTRPRAIGAAIVVALAACTCVPAHAPMSIGGGPGGGGGGGKASEEPKPQAPPEAIPGARSPDKEEIAPATKPASEMDPNAALFDAIDRGDLTAARDALARGADLNARNVLGQRPLDMSIDLSRNDITFLLLSLRAQNGDQAPAQTEETEAAAEPAAAPEAPAAKPDRHHRSRRGIPATPPGPGLNASVSAPAPAPSDSGFLGFGH